MNAKCIICGLHFEPRQHNSLMCSAACKNTRKMSRDKQRDRTGRQNTEKKKEWMRAYWRNNPEKRKEYNKKYWPRRKVAMMAWSEERRHEEAQKRRAYAHQYRMLNPAAREKQREYMNSYKHRMKVAYLALQQILEGERHDAR